MAWYDEAVFYHIYPLGMLDAPRQNQYDKNEIKLHRLRKLKDWIGHIKEIGCNAVYIGPLFESVGHGYETTDYYKLDSRLGDNDDLKKFVSDCHKEGIRVIFDGVFNHVGRDFFAFKDVKENRERSRYCGWFLNVNFYGNNEYNDGFSYDNWGGYNLLVKLNQKNPEVRDYICDVIRFWVREFDVDGIRLDAADVLDFDYMKALRSVANEVKQDFWLMGEVIHGEYTRWVNESTLHSVTNYTLHKALFSGHNDHNYFEIAHTIKRLNDMSGNKGLRLYNFCDNHDVERIVNKLNNRADFLPVHILTYTLPGVPSIYYGSEFGIEGKKEKGSDASLRPALKYEDYKDAIKKNDFTKAVAALGHIRQASATLSYGDYKEVSLTNRQFVYTRNTIDNTVIIAVNNDDNTAHVSGRGIRDGQYFGALSGGKLMVSNGSFDADIAGHSGEIWLPGTEYQTYRKGKKADPIVTVSLPSDDGNAGSKAGKDPGKDTSRSKGQEEIPVTLRREKADEGMNREQNKAAEKGSIRKRGSKKVSNGAGTKYGLPEKYDAIDPDEIKTRSDYDAMSIEELQVAVLEKMASNGPVNDQMIRTVMDNVYPDSLRNWVRSFR